MNRSMGKIISIIVVFTFASTYIFWYGEKHPPSVPRVTFLDIGQGDATLFEFPTGEIYLVDCGKDAAILEALGRNLPWRVRTIDVLMITHPDLDHYGGCIDVLEQYDVEQVVENGLEKHADAIWQTLQRYVEREGVTSTLIEKREAWQVGTSTLTFLYPDHAIQESSVVPGQTTDTGSNNTSIVFRFAFGSSTLLMTGDMEFALETYLLQTQPESVRADILKAGHHGSAGSTSQKFLAVVRPRDTMISAGTGNAYGHPSRRTLRRVERASSTIWRTDLQGDISVLFFPDRYVVE